MTIPTHSAPESRARLKGLSIVAALLGFMAIMVAFATSGPAEEGDAAAGKETLVKAGSTTPSYTKDVQPLFNQRCVACHGCIGSPCNLKLSSFRAVERGALGKNPYSVHFEPYARTGMDVVQTTAQWRKRGFYPVLSRGGTNAENVSRSMIYQMVKAGEAHNKPGFSRKTLMPLYAKRYDHQCIATPEALETELKKQPGTGMPFGLPALKNEEIATLRSWLAGNAPGPSKEEELEALTVTNPKAVLAWENFFNADDKRSQLVARYIFDHVFLATIVLKESKGDIFQLVRSKTASGEANQNPPAAIEIIDTPFPYTNPYKYAGVDKFYYRLKKVTAPIVQKNHFVWELSAADIEHLTELFLGEEWGTSAKLDDPNEAPWDLGNPFRVYQEIPTEARYRFMLENSELIVSGITYGPVCLGQTATYAVKDQFWVYFVDPKYDVSVLEPELGLKTWNAFMDRTPVGNDDYEAAYGAALDKLRPDGYTIDAIWNGERSNPNAWLTVLRHESNVSVMKGRQGGIPRTLWLMDYSGFERIYYDTVANFQYQSGDLPKLETLVFFNYLRQEFEDNFLMLLPESERAHFRNNWTQGVGQAALALEPDPGGNLPTQIKTSKRDPMLSLIGDIQEHMGTAVSGPPDRLNPHKKPDWSLDDPIKTYDDWQKAAAQLTQVRTLKFPRYLPSVILLKLIDAEGNSRVYSVIANRVYATQDTILFQNGQKLPDLYTMSIYPTIIGGFPNYFLEMKLDQADDFLRGLRDVKSLHDWNHLRDRYGILRNDARFWDTYDWFTHWNEKHRGIKAGYLDLSYYDLYDTVY